MGIAAIVSLILPAIPNLIDLAEKLITKPKSGDTKMSTVMQALRALISGVTATTPPVPGAPAVPVKQITDDELKAIIQTVFSQKEASNTLGASTTPTGQMYLVQGTITPLNPAK